MPEALAIAAVFMIAVGVYVGLWIQSRDPSLHKPKEELARMQHQVKWLEERLEKARRQQWDAGLVAGIKAQLDEVTQQIAQATAKPDSIKGDGVLIR